MRSRNSTTVTLAPRRRQTEPSSSPITPPPITIRCSGTFSSASAPVEVTICFSSISTPLQRRHVGAGGDDDVLGADGLALAVIQDLDLAVADQAAEALQPRHLVLAEQELDALGEVRDHLVLAAHQGREVELDLAGLHAVLRQLVAGHRVEVRGLQQRLGRDAADIEAGAAEGAALLDAGGLQAQLRRLDGADIAARAAADHHHVERLFRHFRILLVQRRRSSTVARSFLAP